MLHRIYIHYCHIWEKIVPHSFTNSMNRSWRHFQLLDGLMHFIRLWYLILLLIKDHLRWLIFLFFILIIFFLDKIKVSFIIQIPFWHSSRLKIFDFVTLTLQDLIFCFNCVHLSQKFLSLIFIHAECTPFHVHSIIIINFLF